VSRENGLGFDFLISDFCPLTSGSKATGRSCIIQS
jgi:hypothetical protein